MNNNDVITFEFEREDLEYALGYLADAISKINQAQAMLRSIVCIIRKAMQEDDLPEDNTCAKTKNKVLNFPAGRIPDAKNNTNNKTESDSHRSKGSPEEEFDENEAISLAIELMKVVSFALSYLSENEE